MALLLKNGRLVDPEVGLDVVTDMIVRDGRIVEIGEDLSVPKGQTVECAEKIVVPGLVDVHTHLREPGREDEETVASGTRAAAHGGFTAVCAMPNTNPICDTGSKVRFLIERAEETGVVRVYPVGSLTAKQEGEAIAEIGDMVAEGAVAFSDDGRGVQDAGMMRRVMDYAKAFDTVVVSHCEDESLSADGVVNEGVVSTRLGLAGWPAAAEEIAVARDISLAELTGCRLHLAHLSTAGSVELVRAAKARGVQVTAEVTPHHLFLDEDAIGRTYDTSLKMNPPLRTARDREALVEALLDGTVDCVATDHAPHARHEKELEFELAPFGTTGLETALSLVITHLVQPGRMAWSDVVRVLAHAPRAAFGLPAVRLEAGSVADITIIDPEAKVEVTRERFASKSANSAFLGATLLGRATDVLVEGRFALKNGKVVD
ncbi:MAG: dihydroorotase [Anaerosomatales bacterium]|nr:dihydroorotase [Anaerosomatales bacterium]MDT8433273.1 dihydroorotase [Anaerosomatales bacterium]